MTSSAVLHHLSGTYGAFLSFDASAQGCATVLEVFQGTGLSSAFLPGSVAIENQSKILDLRLILQIDEAR